MPLRDQLPAATLTQLFQAVLSLQSQEECESFFEDICTIKEIQSIAQRLEVARLLNKGENYTEIVEQTGASSTTVSRVNRCLHYGAGGYRRVLPRIVEGEEQNEGK